MRGAPVSWPLVASCLARYGRTEAQCAQRWHKVLQPGLVKGLWTHEEDMLIVDGMRPESAVKDDWVAIADAIPGRVAKQCRERWVNHLDPRLNKGSWTADEDALLACARDAWGNAWKRIAALLPGRAENTVKNRWHSAARRKASPPSAEAVARAREAVARACFSHELASPEGAAAPVQQTAPLAAES